MNERILVTGGLGFLGSTFIRLATDRGRDVLNVDLATYAADEGRIAETLEHHRPGSVRTVRMDVASPEFTELVRRERPALIVHFAAESHVTRSEWEEGLFFRSNVEGTRRVLEAAEKAAVGLVVHISTDEVYGPCSGRPFREEDKPQGKGRASSPYAQSKALADDLARSFIGRVPLIVARPTNCFGPWQHPEKAVPRWIIRGLLGERIPVWGDGMHVRDWMFVDDACAGIELLVRRGSVGEVYNLGPQGNQLANVEIARMIARACGRLEEVVYLTEYDRPLHDRRYAIDASKIRALGWRPAGGLEHRLAETVAWYRSHRDWWAPLLPEAEKLYADTAERGVQRRSLRFQA
jgi:dTDP-glucose 4,6-dehydratase